MPDQDQIKKWEEILQQDLDARVDKHHHAMLKQTINQLVVAWYQRGIQAGKEQASQEHVENSED